MNPEFTEPFYRFCCFLTGPTASGKSDMAIEWSIHHNAEIISMDSAAVYRYMDIGTAKPDARQQSAVAHHLINRIDPTEDFSVAAYLDASREAVADILSRGKTPLFVGGTPLYLKALLRGLFDGPEADWDYRNELLNLAKESGNQRLHKELEKVDPAAAAKLHVNDTRRVVRALEVFRLTGKPISQWQQEHDKPIPQEDCRVWALDIDRQTLSARIERRVDAMLNAGLVQEVRNLRERFGTLSKMATQAVGYRETIDYLDGTLPPVDLQGRFVEGLPALRELIIIHTRQLAKRQMTWFRGLEECRLVDSIPD